MKEEIIEDWVKVYETFEYMTAELSEARLKDEGIDYQVMNKADVGYTMEVGNASLGRQAIGLPIKFFVKPEDVDKATLILNEDRSALLDDPNAEFENNPE